MFVPRGESKRITKAAALGRAIYVTLGLEADFDAAVEAMRYCLRIRNQYAHHNFWDDNTGKLAIGDLEAVARQPDHQPDLVSVIPNHVDVCLLQEQEAYFRYADQLLAWVNFEGRFKSGKLNSNPVPKPMPPLQKPAFNLPHGC